jgi:hypothetical protein
VYNGVAVNQHEQQQQLDATSGATKLSAGGAGPHRLSEASLDSESIRRPTAEPTVMTVASTSMKGASAEVRNPNRTRLLPVKANTAGHVEEQGFEPESDLGCEDVGDEESVFGRSTADDDDAASSASLAVHDDDTSERSLSPGWIPVQGNESAAEEEQVAPC